VNVEVGVAGVTFPPLPVRNVSQFPLYLYVSVTEAPVTPPPVQPTSLPTNFTVAFTFVLLVMIGNPGVVVSVAENDLHVVPVAAAAGPAIHTPTGHQHENCK